MIITTNEQRVEFGNVAVGSEFKIKASAKAFAILSSGLYANKIKAIVRELSCNAIDSHRAAGNLDTPFDVHLPTTLNPYFYVRDYGTGLTNDEVINIYTTYFESTKSDSNVDIGGLGLGSKSPFSYTQNFTVTTFKDGVCSIYTAYINDIGFPAISLMASTETTEPNGVEVRFAVNPSDFYKFKDEAVSVYKWFKHMPRVLGVTFPIRSESQDYIETDIIGGVHLRQYGSSVALMGNVAYPISVPNANEVLGDYANLLERNRLVIEFGIGEVDIQPSREGLSYDKQTISNILSKLVALSTQLEVSVKQKYEAIDNEWDKIELYEELSKSSLYATPNRNYIIANPIAFVDGTMQKRTIKIDASYPQYNVQFTDYYKSHRKTDVNVLVKTKQLPDGSFKTTIEIPTSKKSVSFIANPDNKRIAGLLKEWVKQKTYHSMLVATPIDASKPMDFAGVMAELYNPPTITIADLPERQKVVRDKIEYVAMFKSHITSGQHWYEAGLSAEEIEDTSNTYYYVELNNKDIVENEEKHSIYTYLGQFQHIVSLKGVYVYGIRKAGLKQIQNLPNWKPFLPMAVKEVKKFLTDKSIYDRVAFNDAVNGSTYPKRLTQSRWNDVIGLVTSKPFLDAVNMFKKFDTSPRIAYDLHTLKAYNTKFNLGVDIDKMYKEWYNKYLKVVHAVDMKYPLLRYIDTYEVYNGKQDIANYINSIK